MRERFDMKMNMNMNRDIILRDVPMRAPPVVQNCVFDPGSRKWGEIPVTYDNQYRGYRLTVV